MNWKNETTKKNYCGYCIGSPPSANCDGTCFSEKYDEKRYKEYRKDHIKSELDNIPNIRKQIDDREADLKKELQLLGEVEVVVYLNVDYSESESIFVNKELSKEEITKIINEKFNIWAFYDIVT